MSGIDEATKKRMAMLGVGESETAKEPEGFDPIKYLNKNRIKIDERPNFNTDDLKVAVGEGVPEVYEIAGLGMLGLMSGQEKSRKSTLLSAIVASGLSKGRYPLGFDLNLHGKNSYWIDTEQPDYFAWQTHKRVLHLAGSDCEIQKHRAFGLRGASVDERIQCVDAIIENDKNIGLIILDGALDFVKNMNDVEECQAIVQKYLEWLDKSGAMIITVIHEGRGERSNTIGHLGAFLSRKCDFNIQTVAKLDSEFTMINCKRSRTRPFPTFEFTQDKFGYPVLNHLKENRPSLPESEAGIYEAAGLGTENEFQAPESPNLPANYGREKMNDDDDIPF